MSVESFVSLSLPPSLERQQTYQIKGSDLASFGYFPLIVSVRLIMTNDQGVLNSCPRDLFWRLLRDGGEE